MQTAKAIQNNFTQFSVKLKRKQISPNYLNCLEDIIQYKKTKILNNTFGEKKSHRRLD